MTLPAKHRRHPTGVSAGSRRIGDRWFVELIAGSLQYCITKLLSRKHQATARGRTRAWLRTRNPHFEQAVTSPDL